MATSQAVICVKGLLELIKLFITVVFQEFRRKKRWKFTTPQTLKLLSEKRNIIHCFSINKRNRPVSAFQAAEVKIYIKSRSHFIVSYFSGKTVCAIIMVDRNRAVKQIGSIFFIVPIQMQPYENS